MGKKTDIFFVEWRKHRKLTQEAAAAAIGTSKGYLSDLERGERRYNQDLLEKMAQAYRCEPKDLLSINPLFDGKPDADMVDFFDYWRGMSCLLYTSPSPRDQRGSRMPSSA